MIPTIIHLIAILIANKATWKFLGPYYGQYISDQILMGARFWFVLLGLLLIPFKQIKKVHLFTMITILIMFQPIYAHLVRHSSKEWGPSIGPVLSSIPMELAIMLSTYCIYKAFRGLGVPIILSLIPTILNVFFVNIELPVWTFSCGSFGLAAAITCLAGIVECARRATKSKLITFFIIMSLFNIFFAPFMGLLGIGQCTSIMTHSHLKHLNENTTVLARKESISGFISVVDLESEYGLLRLLRCDHSILGGTFHKFNNNSIYAAFYVLDFVRFVKRETQPKKLRALQIGLGVGISTKILIDNKVDVDVVELDPVVVQFTKDYFQLPEPKRLFIEDGRKFINEQTEIGVYDYVIHDVFSGGRVPASLFSIEAFKKIKTLLKPDGILALVVTYNVDFRWNPCIICNKSPSYNFRRSIF